MNGPLAQRAQRPHDGAHIGGPGLTRRLAEAVQQGSPPPPVIAQRECQRGRGHPLQDQLSAGTRASRWRSGEAGEWVCADAAQEVPRGCIPDGAVAKERLKFLYTCVEAPEGHKPVIPATASQTTLGPWMSHTCDGSDAGCSGVA